LGWSDLRWVQVLSTVAILDGENCVDWKGGTCAVEPTEAGIYPRWFGLPGSLERSLCQAMRRILTSEEGDPVVVQAPSRSSNGSGRPRLP